MKKTALRYICAALALLMLSAVLVSGFSFTSSAAQNNTVSFTSPAIPCDVGQEIDLSKWSVQLTATGDPKSGLTWSSDKLTVSSGKVKATAAGVYPLKAGDGSNEKTVYLVAKNPADTEYVLYNADFSSFDSSDLREIEKTSGAKWGVENGKLYMEAPKDGTVRLAFPEWLGDFGDYKLTAVATIKTAVNSKRWLSLMGRIQNDPGVYYQMCVRQDAKLSNGTEFAERYKKSGGSYAWNVTHTAAYTEKTSASKEYTYEFTLNGSYAITAINGTTLVQANNATKYTVGDVGVQINQCRAEFSSFKVTLAGAVSLEKPASCYADIVDPESNVVLPPVPVTEAGADLDALLSSGAVAAIFDVDSALNVKTGGTLESVISKIKNKLVPIFRVADSSSATAVAKKLKELSHSDAFIMSSDASAVKAGRSANNLLLGIIDYSSRTDISESKLINIRDEVNSHGARVALLPASAATRDNVEYLQQLFITVWTTSDAGAVGDISAITAGANGIVTPDPGKLVARFTEFFKENSIVRPSQIIAHRGVPSLFQENSLAGAIKAYELGATSIENDIQLTKDGVVVVMHDSTIDRTTSGTGSVSSYTYEELQKFVLNGSSSLETQPIPTLEEYFKEFKDKDVRIVVEFKNSGSTIVYKTAELIEQYDIADQINFITFNHSQIALIHQLMPEISCGALTSSITTSDVNAYLSAEDVLALTQPLGSTYNPSYKTGLCSSVYKALSYRGMTVWPYTLNDQTDFNTHFLSGAYGITTNHTNWMTSVIRILSAPATLDLDPTAGSLEFAPTATTYGRTTAPISDAEMIFIDGDKDLLTYADGKLTASSESGQATVMFCTTAKLAGGKAFTVYSEPVKISVGAPVIDDTDETTVTDTPTTPEESQVTEPTDDAGCAGCSGSSIAIASLALAAIFGCAVIIKKK